MQLGCTEHEIQDRRTHEASENADVSRARTRDWTHVPHLRHGRDDDPKRAKERKRRRYAQRQPPSVFPLLDVVAPVLRATEDYVLDGDDGGERCGPIPDDTL